MIEILAEFSSGREAVYTYSIFELLVSDEDVVRITEVKTGRLLYEKK